MNRCHDKIYDVTSMRFYTSCVTSLFRPIICILNYLCIERPFKPGCDSRDKLTGMRDN